MVKVKIELLGDEQGVGAKGDVIEVSPDRAKRWTSDPGAKAKWPGVSGPPEEDEPEAAPAKPKPKAKGKPKA